MVSSPNSKLNKEELCSKAEASACAPEEPILLSEEDKKKANVQNPSSIKKNFVVKQKQVLLHLRSQYHYLKMIKRKERKHSKFKPNKEEFCCKEEAIACTPEE